jgi:hypothetical protein
MEDLEVMKLFESLDHLYEDLPDVLLAEARAQLRLLVYLRREIAVGCEFHHDAV